MCYFLLRAKNWICINKLYTVSLCCWGLDCVFPSPPSIIHAWAILGSEHIPTTTHHNQQPPQSSLVNPKISLMPTQRGDSHPALTFGEKNQVAPTKNKKRKSSPLCLQPLSQGSCFSWFNIWTIYFCVKPPNYTPGAKWRSNPFTPSSLDNQHSTSQQDFQIPDTGSLPANISSASNRMKWSHKQKKKSWGQALWEFAAHGLTCVSGTWGFP